MSEIFEARDVQYDLPNKNTLGVPNARTTSYGLETVSYLGQKTVTNITSQNQRVPINESS